MQVLFYDKDEVKVASPSTENPFCGIHKLEAKLTETEAAMGLLRFRITIDLDAHWTTVSGAASAKVVYPEP